MTILPTHLVTAGISLSLSLSLSAIGSIGCVASEDDEPRDPAACAGKCDGPGAGLLDPARPGELAVLRLLADAGRDGRVDLAEADALAAFVKDASGTNPRVAAFLTAIAEGDGRLDGAAAARLRIAASGERPGDVPLANTVYRLELGASPFLSDDRLFLVGDGVVGAATGLRSHSRGYAAKRDGVLFTRHGSLAPHHPAVATEDETAALRARGPDVALDAAALVGGLTLSPFTTFSATAHSPAYYDPSSSTPDWAGICQGWTHNALDDRLSVLVDPPGAPGARGLWIYGQWVSRADLGNAMMGASYSLGIADSTTIDSFVRPDSLVKALAQHVMRSGVGLRVDIWNDAHNPSGVYNPQIWNQPIVEASIEVASVSPAARDAVLDHARRDPRRWQALPIDAGVKLVTARARWGAETRDDWELEARFRTSTWAMYLIVGPDGLVATGYMAHDLTAAGVTPLPVTVSDGLPDYLAVPRHELTDAAFAGAPHRLLGRDNPEGARFRFVVGGVFALGIPEPTRVAFEAEAFARDVSPTELSARFPGIANAYTPAQWARVFESRLGPATAFGAHWAR